MGRGPRRHFGWAARHGPPRPQPGFETFPPPSPLPLRRAGVAGPAPRGTGKLKLLILVTRPRSALESGGGGGRRRSGDESAVEKAAQRAGAAAGHRRPTALAPGGPLLSVLRTVGGGAQLPVASGQLDPLLPWASSTMKPQSADA